MTHDEEELRRQLMQGVAKVRFWGRLALVVLVLIVGWIIISGYGRG